MPMQIDRVFLPPQRILENAVRTTFEKHPAEHADIFEHAAKATAAAAGLYRDIGDTSLADDYALATAALFRLASFAHVSESFRVPDESAQLLREYARMTEILGNGFYEMVGMRTVTMGNELQRAKNFMSDQFEDLIKEMARD